MMVRFSSLVAAVAVVDAFVVPAPRRAAPRVEPRTRRCFFDSLQKSFTEAADAFSGKKTLTEKNIASALKDVKRALIDADVSLVVANALVDRVEASAVGAEVIKGVEPAEQFIKIMYDELVRVMGGDDFVGAGKEMAQQRAELANAAVKPTVILLCGLQGAGKTTAAAKLARYLSSGGGSAAVEAEAEKRTVMLVAADVYRPAAVEQLKILGAEVGVSVYSEAFEAGAGDAVAIARRGVEAAKARGDIDTVVIDTAGRQVIDEALMRELVTVSGAVKPDETLLVLDAMTGQEAAKLTARFDAACSLTGAILTKLDGDTRGGAALSIRAVSGRPIKFVGVGEKITDLEPFYPARMASRILGMGDVVTLVEKAQNELSEADQLRQLEKVRRAEFDFDDYIQQSKMVKNMGNLGAISKLMPGMGAVDSAQIAAAEDRIKRGESIIGSMTKHERANPDLLIRDKSALSRQRRVARGAGRDLQATKLFVSEFQQMRAMMARMSNNMPGADPSTAPAQEQPAGLPAGNRAMRRVKGAKKKSGKSKLRGFG